MSDFSTDDFIGDFLEEAAQHLLSINQNLLELEQSLSSRSSKVESAVLRVPLISSLFRSFHTVKGLSGMVGLNQAEELSHLMESVLRGIQNMQIDVDLEVVNLLLVGARALEATIVTVSDPAAELPDIDSLKENFQALLESSQEQPEKQTTPGVDDSPPPYRPGYPEPDIEAEQPPLLDEFPALAGFPEISANLNTYEQGRLREARRAGRSVYMAIFIPSAEKTGQGMNVSEIRQILSQTGEVVKAVPLIDGTDVRFAFIFSSSELSRRDLPDLELIPLAQEGKGHPEAGVKTAKQSVSDFDAPASAPAQLTNVRVDLRRLDEIMRLVSDLVVSRSRLANLLPKLAAPPAQTKAEPSIRLMEQTIVQMGRYLRDMRNAIMRARMVPLAEVFSHMPLAVRDLARGSGKEVRLEVRGENTEIDKMLVERLLDPLLHLVRNAIVHGIETPAERAAAGKPEAGVLTLQGKLAGDKVLVTISDDGRGIDYQRIADLAAAQGLLEETQSPDDVLSLIVRPGFTTIEQAGLGAGRGIGMDIVFQMVRSVGGSLEMSSVRGQGTSFTLQLPLTLSIVYAIIVRTGGERFAVPQHMVEEVIEIDNSKITRVEGGELFPYRENSLALLRLSDLFQIQTSTSSRYLYGLIPGDQEGRVVLVVDQLVGAQEVVVRPINDPLVNCQGVYAATELGDGSVILILDLPALLQLHKS